MTKTQWQWIWLGITVVLGLIVLVTIQPFLLKLSLLFLLTMIWMAVSVALELQKRRAQQQAESSLRARWTEQLDCPLCHQPMEKGWIAIYDPIIITRAVWQDVRPGYVRLRAPAKAVNVMQPQVGGHGSPEAFLCRACEITVSSYDQRRTT